MRLNRRTLAQSGPPIAAAHDLLRHRAPDRTLLDLSQGMPNDPMPPSLVEVAAAAARRPDAGAYPPRPGMPMLRERLAAELALEYRGRVLAEDVLITAGCNQAYCLTISALADPGDEVILASPYYFNHDGWLRLNGITPVHLPTGDRAVPDPELARSLTTERTRAIVLVTPGNPTGVTIPDPVLSAFADLAAERDVVLVVDETYRAFRDTREPAHLLFSRPGWRERVVSLYSFSKEFAMAGYRIGAVVGHPGLLTEVGKLLDCVAIAAPRIAQQVALAALEQPAEWRRERARHVAEKQRRFRRVMDDRPGGFELTAAGTFFGWVRHPFPGEGAACVVERLVREQGVLVLPGTLFTADDDGHLRFSVAAVEMEDIPDLGDRLEQFGNRAGHPGVVGHGIVDHKGSVAPNR